jgi:hypothetical protein
MNGVDARVKELFESGKSYNEIHGALGVPISSIHWRLRRQGVDTRRRSFGCEKHEWRRWAQENRMCSLHTVRRAIGRKDGIIRAKMAELGIAGIRHGTYEFIKEEERDRVSEALSRIILVPRPWQDAGVQPWEMGWLAGAMDGEGSISIAKRAVIVAFSNTEPIFQERVETILGRLEIRYYECIAKPKLGHKNGIQVGVTECLSVWRVCREMAPFLALKRERAELMMEFSEIRAKNAGRKGTGFASVVREYEEKMKRLPPVRGR